MPTACQSRTSRTGQVNALAGRLEALKEEKIPVRGAHREDVRRSCGIMDASYLPLPRHALSAVLREVEMPLNLSYSFVVSITG